jgi:hypothetical protein
VTRRAPHELADSVELAAALFIGPLNSKPVTGNTFRTNLALAGKYGIEVLQLGPRKRLIPAADLVRAIRAEHAAQQPAEPLTVEEHARAVLRRIGYEPIQ